MEHNVVTNIKWNNMSTGGSTMQISVV